MPRAPSSFVTGLLVVLSLSATAMTADATQNVVVDEGTFLLSQNGRPIGTENFTIRRSGRGPSVKFIATAEVRMDVDGSERRVTSALEATGPDMSISAYQVKEAGDRPSELYLTLTGRRFQATHRSSDGEELREYRASPSAVVLQEGLAHHYHFVAARASGATTTAPALVPTTGEVLRLEITDAGTERTSIAGRMVQARHLIVEDGGGSREVWVDDRGRILRVVESATGFRAERRNLPD